MAVLRAIFRVLVSMACLIPLVSPAVAVAEECARERSRVFRGAWFEVRYPSDFIPRPSLRSTTAEGYDSVEFVSPDGAVSFYVYAPQWGGVPTDIALVPGRERVVSDQRRQEQDREVRWFTIAAVDGSYRRSYRETVAQQGAVRTIVGIRYRSEEARARHGEAYERFRQSLKLFAD